MARLSVWAAKQQETPQHTTRITSSGYIRRHQALLFFVLFSVAPLIHASIRFIILSLLLLSLLTWLTSPVLLSCISFPLSSFLFPFSISSLFRSHPHLDSSRLSHLSSRLSSFTALCRRTTILLD